VPEDYTDKIVEDMPVPQTPTDEQRAQWREYKRRERERKTA